MGDKKIIVTTGTEHTITGTDEERALLGTPDFLSALLPGIPQDLSTFMRAMPQHADPDWHAPLTEPTYVAVPVNVEEDDEDGWIWDINIDYIICKETEHYYGEPTEAESDEYLNKALKSINKHIDLFKTDNPPTSLPDVAHIIGVTATKRRQSDPPTPHPAAELAAAGKGGFTPEQADYYLGFKRDKKPVPNAGEKDDGKNQTPTTENNGEFSPNLGAYHLGFERDENPLFDLSKPSSSNTSKTVNSKKKNSHYLTSERIAIMMNNSETKTALEKASKVTGVNIEDLMMMAMIESRGNGHVGTNKYGYTGLMQLGEKAVKEIQKTDNKITYEGVKNSVEMNALGGAIYWKQNANQLREHNISNSVLHQYLAHQQGGAGLRHLLNILKTDPDAPIIENQRTNLPQEFIKPHNGKVTQQEFYDYWSNRISNMQNNVKAFMDSQ